jgi:hypothetical protein
LLAHAASIYLLGAFSALAHLAQFGAFRHILAQFGAIRRISAQNGAIKKNKNSTWTLGFNSTLNT